MIIDTEIENLEHWWKFLPWSQHITRPYTAETVIKLRGSMGFKGVSPNAFAVRQANVLQRLLEEQLYVTALGAMNGNQAVQMAKAGMQAIYLSGWQVAGGANVAGQLYPDQSLYPANSGPELAKEINNALTRADQIYWMENFEDIKNAVLRTEIKLPNWHLPIVADAEAGFGGVLNVFELTKAYIEAGVAGIHFEDQLSSAKKCGHMGGKVLIPTQHAINNLVAARLATDVLGVPTLIIARTDALGAKLITSDIDGNDINFLTGKRTSEGYYEVEAGMDQAVSRALSYAPYADLIWFETSTPDLGQAEEFSERVRAAYPDKLFAYNCSPSFNWKANLSDKEILGFQEKIAKLGYAFQFITLAGFHAMNYSMFEVAQDFAKEGMPGYVKLQEKEFAAEKDGYTAVKHQREVGATYFDEVNNAIMGGKSSTGAMKGSTEDEQF